MSVACRRLLGKKMPAVGGGQIGHDRRKKRGLARLLGEVRRPDIAHAQCHRDDDSAIAASSPEYPSILG